MRAARVLVPAVLLLASACSGSSSDNAAPKSTATPCPTPPASAPPALTSGVPDPGGSAYDYSAQGKTLVWFYEIDGSASTLASLRDAYDGKLTAAGYKILDTDAEPNAEAESSFAGAHSGTTNFRPLCDGKVVLRLKLTE